MNAFSFHPNERKLRHNLEDRCTFLTLQKSICGIHGCKLKQVNSLHSVMLAVSLMQDVEIDNPGFGHLWQTLIRQQQNAAPLVPSARLES